MARLLITGARVLAPDALSAPHRDVLVAAGRVAALLDPGTMVDDAERFDATDRLIIPGLVNAHTHGHGGLSKGAGDKWDLALLLTHAPWISGSRGLDDKRLATTLGAVEMLKKGCTAAYDLALELPCPSTEGLDAMAEAYATVGLKAVLAPMVADLTFFQATPGLLDALPAALRARPAAMRLAEPRTILDAIDAAARGWTHASRGIRLGCAPTIPLHCSDAFLTGCRDLAERHGMPMQTHVAEARYQAAGGMERYGTTLLAHMDRLGLVGPRFSAAHGVWLTDEDLALLAGRGGGLAHNPGANMRLASGIAPARRALAAGVTVGIGTDGSSSSDNQNMFEAMRLAAFASRLIDAEDESAWLGTDETVRLATRGSSKLLGLEGGAIEPGAPADLVLLDLGHVNWSPLNDAANQLVWTEDGSAVTDVMVDGTWRLAARRVLGVDEAALSRAANTAAERLREANRDAREWCEALAPHVACHCRALSRRFIGATRLLPVH